MDLTAEIDVNLEPQPHGGALQRTRAVPSLVYDAPMPNPAEFGWPATLPLELAMHTAPIQELCESYGISQDFWNELRFNPVFRAEVAAAAEALRKDGAAFKFRAQLQSVELLKISWKMIFSEATPAAVRADLIKFTITAAGLNASKDQGFAGKAGGGVAFHLELHLGG